MLKLQVLFEADYISLLTYETAVNLNMQVLINFFFLRGHTCTSAHRDIVSVIILLRRSDKKCTHEDGLRADRFKMAAAVNFRCGARDLGADPAKM